MKKRFLLIFCLLFTMKAAAGGDRFGRTVIKVKDPKAYQFKKLDDVEFPSLSNDRFDVTCLVYRRTERYYVEITVKNKTAQGVALPPSFVSFIKPGYTVYRTDTLAAAREAASAVGARFVATPPPYIPPTVNTTVNATATASGNQTQINGTATSTPDYSGQAGANFGNALGNAIAARRFYKAQRTEVAFSEFLAAHLQTEADAPLLVGETRTVIATFAQAKQKKAPFDVILKVGDQTFTFSYKE